MKIVILFDGNFYIDGQPTHCKKGQVMDLSKEDAERMIADLQAEPFTDKKVKHDNKNK